MLDPLATPTDLQQLLGTGPYVDDQLDQVTRLLRAASAEIRTAIGQQITRSTDTAALTAPISEWLALPQCPVVSVDQVLVDGVLLPGTSWRLVEGRLFRQWGWYDQLTSALPVQLLVTYTHGYADVPDDLVTLCCSLAAVALDQTGDGTLGAPPGSPGYAIDDYRENASPADGPAHVMQLSRDATARLRARYGNGQYTTAMSR